MGGGRPSRKLLAFRQPPQKQQERLEHELRNRPQNCDADHKRGRDHPTANGVHGVVSVSHRENTMLVLFAGAIQ
jgi:hypothetical protein